MELARCTDCRQSVTRQLADVIDPEFFGCSAKLSFDETCRLAEVARAGASDFSFVDVDRRATLSVDRVNRCAKDWLTFAKIALNHAVGDVEVAMARPLQVLLSYEFGPDVSGTDKLDATRAFASVLNERGISLGKCHSAIGSGPTAVTITVIATSTRLTPSALQNGAIFLNRPIGAFKLHYMNEMGIWSGDLSLLQPLVRRDIYDIKLGVWEGLSDVSGHGLAGSLLNVARQNEIDIDISLGRHLLAADAVLEVPIECLQNKIVDYVEQQLFVDEMAWSIAGLKETAGPILGFANTELAVDDPFGTGELLHLGSYQPGSGRVTISWSD